MLDEERLDEGTPDEGSDATEVTDTRDIDTGTDIAHSENENNGEVDGTDYAALAESDMRELSALFPALRGKRSIAELDNPMRYAALRDLGLTPKEAYLATSEPVRRADTQSHLRGTVPRGAGGGFTAMTAREMDAARELFSGLSDREIRKLYNKVTK